MHARLTLLEIDLVRTGMDAVLDRFKVDVLPHLRDQPGYRGVFVLTTPDGKGALMSLWDTEAQSRSDRDSGFYADALGAFATLFRAPPGRASYEVAFAEEPAGTP